MPIGIEIATATSLGTSTTKTQLNGGNDVTLPATAKSILAVVPYLCHVTPTAGEPCWAKLELESDDFSVVPYAVLAQPVGSMLGKSGFTSAGPLSGVRWPVNCPVGGGDKLKVYGTALTANTVAPYMGAAIVVSDALPASPQLRAKVGTVTDTGTAAGEVAGTSYSFTGGRKVVELFGAVVGTTVAASKPIVGYFRMESSEFYPPFPVKFPCEPIQGRIATDATTASAQEVVPGVSRFPVDINVRSPTTVQDYFNLELALTTTGKFVTGVMFL
jgi:hypothetical protein